MDDALKGILKLNGNLNPNNSARPTAISEYPEKSKYNCKAKEDTRAQASGKVSEPAALVNPKSTKGAILSAKKVFLNKPTKNTKIPNEKRFKLVNLYFLILIAFI